MIEEAFKEWASAKRAMSKASARAKAAKRKVMEYLVSEIAGVPAVKVAKVERSDVYVELTTGAVFWVTMDPKWRLSPYGVPDEIRWSISGFNATKKGDAARLVEAVIQKVSDRGGVE